MLKNLKRTIAIKAFKKRKALKYILFDKLYSIFILNRKNIPEFVNNYDKEGFVKISPKIDKELKNLKSNLVISNDKNKIKLMHGEEKLNNKPPFYFDINDNVKNSIDEILKKLEKSYIFDLKKYFRSEILPAFICLRRNEFYKKQDLDHELFNDNFHNDAYLFTQFKIFINLNDIGEKNGPMRIVSKKNTKKFLDSIGYTGRQNYNEKKDTISYSNVGKSGDGLIFDPTNCFHKAGVPDQNYKRDYLIITYVCIPDCQKNLYTTDIYKYNQNELLRLSKPTKLNQTLKLFLNFYKKRVN